MLTRFCLHVRINKLQHDKGIWLPILYHELNKNDTILVQGWVRDIGSSGPNGTWHLWCETAGGERIDPQVKLLEMDDLYYNLEYTTEQPDKVDETDEVKEQWELYEKDPREFWKLQPAPVRNFRSKINSLIMKNKF